MKKYLLVVCLLVATALWAATKLNLASQFQNILHIANGGIGANSTSANFVFSGPCTGSAGPPSFKDCGSIPKPNTRRWSYYVADGTTVPTNVLGDTFLITATAQAATASAPASIAIAAQPGSSPGLAFWSTTVTTLNSNYSQGSNADFETYLQVPRIDQQVTFFGFNNRGSAAFNTTGDWIVFSTRTGQGNSSPNWQCTTTTGGVRLETDSGIAIDTNFHRFEIDLTSSAANFSIDGSSVCNLTSGLPPASTMLSVGASGYANNAGAAYNISLAWLYVESDF